MGVKGTRTGAVLERTVLPVLHGAGYQFDRQVQVGVRPGGGRHVVDAVAAKDGRTFLLSLKWQQVQGTAEQKVPFEVLCLADALDQSDYDRAYLVLGGEGWKLREFFTSGGLRRFLPTCDRVEVITFERFIALANQGQL